jgi:hypothetical protein
MGDTNDVQHVLAYIKKCFSLLDFFSVTDSYNPDAGRAYVGDHSEFLMNVTESVDSSIANIYNDYNGEFDLQISEYNTVHERLLDIMKKGNELDAEKQADLFIEWALNCKGT